MNRLKELAQRQQDINERLKEMQTALQEAKTEKEKEEAKRQLKRLQEEQQQMLADMDELKQSMEQSSNQSQLAEERQRLEQSREQAQKAGEAMREEKPTEALASGTRAERDLQKLRDDFRQKSSARFRDQMRDMRQDARELAQTQENIGKQLEEMAAPKENALKSLDGQTPRETLGEQFAGQQEKLEGLQKEMREVSEQAEAAEPLLARELYDALRKNAQAGTEDTLKKAGMLSARGYASQARPFEEKARKEVEELKTGVERAAESVLGDEAESLRQARAELDALAQAINREIARARPELADAGDKGKKPGNQPGDQKQGEGKSGEKADNEKAPGSKPGEEAEGAGEGQKPGEKGQGKEPGDKPGEGQGEKGEKGDNPQGGATASSPGQRPGKKGEGEQPAAGEQGQKGKGKGEGEGQPGDQPGKGAQPGSPQGQTPGSPGQGNGQGGDNQNASPQNADDPAKPGSRLREMVANAGPRPRGGIRTGAGGNGADDRGGGLEWEEGPLTGDAFVKWSDRLRNVEEMLDSHDLREQVAQVREDARTVRSEFKRHSKEPQWDTVRMKIGKPLAELRDRVAEELARRDSKESLVPIDRDPVPPKYAERVRRYYEELGK